MPFFLRSRCKPLSSDALPGPLVLLQPPLCGNLDTVHPVTCELRRKGHGKAPPSRRRFRCCRRPFAAAAAADSGRRRSRSPPFLSFFRLWRGAVARPKAPKPPRRSSSARSRPPNEGFERATTTATCTGIGRASILLIKKKEEKRASEKKGG